jgi:hypothetical protein
VVKLLLALPGIDYNHENDEVWCQYIPLLCMPQKVYMAINPSSFISPFLQPQNNTALTFASDKGHVEVVKLLVALPGIDYNHENDEVWCQYIPLLCMPQKVYTRPLILHHLYRFLFSTTE